MASTLVSILEHIHLKTSFVLQRLNGCAQFHIKNSFLISNFSFRPVLCGRRNTPRPGHNQDLSWFKLSGSSSQRSFFADDGPTSRKAFLSGLPTDLLISFWQSLDDSTLSHWFRPGTPLMSSPWMGAFASSDIRHTGSLTHLHNYIETNTNTCMHICSAFVRERIGTAVQHLFGQ